MNTNSKISLRSLFQRFRIKILFTWFLVIGESSLFLLFPLFMGIAIDDILKNEYLGLILLGGIALLSLLIGAGRRFYDTRIYSKIYAIISPESVEREKKRDTSVSVISARANLATEFVEFLENSFPEIINSSIGLVGTLAIIAALNIQVFIACLISTILIGVIYALSSGKTYYLNKKFNEELENQVTVISQNNKNTIVNHFNNVVKWNVKLSDLETVNFSASWVFLMAVLIYAVPTSIAGGMSTQGQILAILMYVFNYIESIIMLPLFYQQIVRLKEITHRLEGEEK